MMRWVKTTVSSVWGMLGFDAGNSKAILNDRKEEIAEVMLDVLGEQGTMAHPGVGRRIKSAADLTSLWYMRSDWMIAVSATQGEAAAQAHVRRINEMFSGLLPLSLQSRTSGLSRY